MRVHAHMYTLMHPCAHMYTCAALVVMPGPEGTANYMLLNDACQRKCCRVDAVASWAGMCTKAASKFLLMSSLGC